MLNSAAFAMTAYIHDEQKWMAKPIQGESTPQYKKKVSFTDIGLLKHGL